MNKHDANHALRPDQTRGSTGALRDPLLTLAALAQFAIYAGTGIWPLLSMSSFEAVTGPKQDQWLVQTVGLLVLVIGAVILLAWARRRLSFEIVLLACGSALSLAAIEVIFVARGRISSIYLLDAAAELALVSLWLIGSWRASQARSARRRAAVSPERGEGRLAESQT